MGGFFGAVSRHDVISDVFFGSDIFDCDLLLVPCGGDDCGRGAEYAQVAF